jgi:hypothetical protein
VLRFIQFLAVPAGLAVGDTAHATERPRVIAATNASTAYRSVSVDGLSGERGQPHRFRGAFGDRHAYSSAPGRTVDSASTHVRF